MINPFLTASFPCSVFFFSRLERLPNATPPQIAESKRSASSRQQDFGEGHSFLREGRRFLPGDDKVLPRTQYRRHLCICICISRTASAIGFPLNVVRESGKLRRIPCPTPRPSNHPPFACDCRRFCERVNERDVDFFCSIFFNGRRPIVVFFQILFVEHQVQFYLEMQRFPLVAVMY